MKQTLLLGLALSCLMLVAVQVQAQTLKLGTLAPKGSPWYTILRDMGETWKKVSNGNIQFRIYPGGVAGDEPDMVRKLRIGQLHAAVLTGVGLSAIAPEIQALQMPMMLSSYEELDYVMDRLAPKLEQLLEEKGFKVLNWGDAGWVRFFAQTPVVYPEDLKPLRLFAWAGDSEYVEAWKDAGYNPVSLAANEIHTGLQSGLINVFVAPPIAALSFQWFGLAKHMTDLKWGPLIAATIILNGKWNEIPDDVKTFLLKSAQNAGERFRREVRRLDNESVQVMKKHGLVVHPVPPKAVAAWERSARAGYPKIVGKIFPEEMLSEVEKFRDEYRVSKKGR